MKLTSFYDKFLWNTAEPGAGGGEGEGAPADPAPAAPEPTAPDLSWIGEDFRADGQVDLGRFREHYEGLLSEQTRRDEAAAQVPDAYDYALPADFDLGVELPEGVQISLAADDPEFAPVFEELGGFLRENGLPQAAATGLMGMLAKWQATQVSKGVKEFDAAWNQLGPTEAAREARINNVRRAIETRLPGDDAKALMDLVHDPRAVRAIEKLVTSNGQRTPAPRPGGSAIPENATPYERLKAANAALAKSA